MFYKFDPLRRPVFVAPDATEVLAGLPELTAGWPYERAENGARDTPRLHLERKDGSFIITAPWLEEPIRETGLFRAGANFAVDLIEAYLDENPDLLAVHCGAVEFAGRVVLFPGRSKAGKSTLCARLAAEHLPIFGDDVLCLTGAQSRTAMSLGLFARLRLPLPDHASEEFRGFIAAHKGAANEDYAYLALPEATSPSFGRSAPLGAVVLLERIEGAPAKLTRVEAGDGLQELIVQNLSPELAMQEAVPRLIHAIADVPCLCLTYWDLDEAVNLLLRQFSDWEDGPPLEASAATVFEWHFPGEAAPIEPLQGSFRQRAGIARHDVDGEAFLVDSGSNSVLRLNTISAAIWTLLEDGADIAHCVDILAGAFPDVEPERIARDVEDHFAELHETGLIVDVQP